MIRIFDGVWSWGYFNPEKKYNFNGFLIDAGGYVVVMDPPPLSEDDRAYFQALGLRPDLVVITNRNHWRGREEWKAPAAMHEAEIAQVGEPVERALKDGEVIAPGMEVVHLPGKSPGEIGLHWRTRRLLLLGDALIAPQGQLKLIPDAKLDDPALLRRSLRKLGPLDFDALLLADGDPLLRGAKHVVDAFVAAS